MRIILQTMPFLGKITKNNFVTPSKATAKARKKKTNLNLNPLTNLTLTNKEQQQYIVLVAAMF